MSDPEKRVYLPQTLTKALAVLACFNRLSSELTASEIAKQVDMSPSRLYRYLSVLESAHYLEHVPGTTRFVLGPRCIELGGVALGRYEVRRHGQVELESLAQALGGNANLAILYEGDTFHLAFAVRTEVDQLYAVIGRRSPAHCTALGKVLLSYEPWPKAHMRIIQYGWRPQTQYSITDFEQLKTELAEIRARGYAIDREECTIGTACVAAPVRSKGGDVVAAISASSRATTLHGRRFDKTVLEVVRHSERLSLRLGYSARPSISADQTDAVLSSR
jgi:DNA-binding IclR family transcriptional regulator